VVSDMASAGLNLCCSLDRSCVCMASSKAGHESGPGASGLDPVVASGMHIDSLFWFDIWIMCSFR
jgi:hypothetical protein